MNTGTTITNMLLFVFFTSQVTFAQTTAGSILGTVSDSTGAVIPGVVVTPRNIETGLTRAVTTDAAGRYRAPQLPLGSYEVSAEAAGFQTMVRGGITLTVGREAVVDFTMQVGAVSERITVTGEAPLIETTTSEVSGGVSQTQMRDLPLNSRSYEQLAYLQPNVYSQRNFQATVNTGYVPRISAAGMRTNMNAFIVDGIDIMDTLGQTPGSAAGQIMGVETLREFRVLTNNSKAQYGRAVGAIIDVASRSGTNELHGTVFEFLRNDKMDARSFFDTTPPPLRRNQFGGVLGGPIRKDKIFFFGSYEALRARTTTFNVEFVPTVAAKQGILPTGTVPVNLAMKPYLALYPNPQVDVGGGIGTYTFPFAGTTREDYFTTRFDYQHSQNVSYFARYSFDDTSVLHRKGPLILPPFGERLFSRNQIVTVAETRIISPQLINEFRAGFVRTPLVGRNALTGPDPKIQFPGTVGHGTILNGFGFVGAAALASIGSAGFPFLREVGNTFQVTDNLSYVTGPHSFKMGLNIEYFQDNVGSRAEQDLYAVANSYTFQTLQDLLAGTPRSFSGTLVLPPAGISGRQWLYGFYVQDDYRWRPNFTLNLGLRYEWASNYSNTNHRFIILNDLFGTPKPGQEFGWQGRVCAGCVDPRFGFAWDLFSNQKIVLKGGFGVYRSQLVRFLGYFDLNGVAQTPGGVAISATNPSFPNPLATAGPNTQLIVAPTGLGIGGVTILTPIPKTPTALQWNLTLEQQITRDMTLRLAYIASKGYHLPYGTNANTNSYVIRPDGSRFFAPGVHRIRPDYGLVNYSGNDAISYYNGFEITLGQRARRGLAFEASYAFSRATDDGSIAFGQNALQANEPWPHDERRNVNHGLSAMDMRQRFVSSVTYDFPSLASSNVFAKKLLSGWQANSIIMLQAGVPMTPLIGFDQANSLGLVPSVVQRASLKPSLPSSFVLCPCQMPASLGGGNQGPPQRYFDPTTFVLPAAGTYGNAGRGIMTSPGLANVDVAMVKKTAITERMELQFRAEAFNLFNTVNWGLPSTTIFQNATGAFATSAGRITSTSTEGRKLQFALKLVF